MRALGAVLTAALVVWPPPAAHADAACGLEDPAIAEEAPPPGKRAEARRSAPPRGGWGPLVARVDPPTARQRVGHGAAGGALAGKTVYISAGHGFYWSATLGRWATQRPNTHDLVEDLISAETIAQHLIPMLRDMGAYVVPVRETSMQRAIAITDDADPGFAATGATAVAAGWARPPDTIADAANPFAGGGSVTIPTGAAGAVASWDLDVPADGDYEVYVAWVQGADRAPDAHYVVHHAGGETHFRVDQRRHGGTWVLLGQLPFRAADPVERRAIELHGDSAAAGAVVSADAVRIGGGMGRIDRGSGVSGRAAFEDAARYAAQWNGAPPTVWDYAGADNADDVGTRSRFAAWDHEDGEDAVYVAWHTNAANGTARGTSSFAYGPEAFGTLAQFTGVPGSLELMDAIHDELVADFRAAWDPDWQDRGQHTAYFGEVNPNHNPEMPATLIEVAFHDTAADAEALRDPRFRRLAARAIAHGIARYFAARDGAALTLPPEPPTALRLVNGDGGLTLSWGAPAPDPAGGDPATAYRVYVSRDGRAFDAGTPVDGTSLAIDAAPGEAVFARVTATNAGGESRPSPVVGARRGDARVLVVAGFTRIDGTMLLREDLSAFSLATIDRALEDRINDESHLARHGRALARAQISFDGITADAFAGDEPHAVIDWIAGAEVGLDDVAPALDAWVAGGRALLVSGTDVARALDLGATVVTDGVETYAIAGAPGTAFDGLAADFGDDGPGSYDAAAADVLAAVAPAEAILTYEGGGVAGALVPGQSIVLGFPIETIGDDEVRADLMARALAALGVEPDVPEVPDDPDDPDDGSVVAGCGCRGGAGGSGLVVVLVLAAALTARRRGSKTSGLP